MYVYMFIMHIFKYAYMHILLACVLLLRRAVGSDGSVRISYGVLTVRKRVCKYSYMHIYTHAHNTCVCIAFALCT